MRVLVLKREQRAIKQRLVRLERVCLVHDNRVPLDLVAIQQALILIHNLRRGQQHMKLEIVRVQFLQFAMRTRAIVRIIRPTPVEFLLNNTIARRRRAMIHHHIEIGPRAKLATPMAQSGQRCHDQERSAHLVAFKDEVDKCDRLHSLAETHLVRQNARHAILPIVDEPVDAVLLVLSSECVPALERLVIADSQFLRGSILKVMHVE
mmetsp:Transcript_35108/g.57364  ORF Transcript_35108/g.57364 Transcript_35108/m.57364 type:complete len:207 (+) Transcript_35108:1462-2082(+)